MMLYLQVHVTRISSVPVKINSVKRFAVFQKIL